MAGGASDRVGARGSLGAKQDEYAKTRTGWRQLAGVDCYYVIRDESGGSSSWASWRKGQRRLEVPSFKKERER